MALRTFKYQFVEFKKVGFLDVQKQDYEFLGPFAYLKHHLSDMFQVAFFDDHDAGNDFA
jgi:hypothetical protein